MGNPFARVESQLNDGLDSFLLKIDTRIDLDVPILCILLHPCKDMAAIGINVLSFCGIENVPYVWEVFTIIYSCEPHDRCDIALGVPLGFGLLSSAHLGWVPL